MKEQFLFELTREAKPARLLLERLPEEAFDWRPHPKARTLGELAWHMASLPAVISEVIQNPEQDRAEVVWPALEPGVQAAVHHLDRSVETAFTNLNRLDDALLDEMFRMHSGGKELFRMSRAQFFRWGMLTHFVHHRAQLGVYVRLLDLPVPALVGPSMDNNPFAPPKATA